jgi:hypothetical protein
VLVRDCKWITVCVVGRVGSSVGGKCGGKRHNEMTGRGEEEGDMKSGV